ncbi:MAG: helix-turn-helix domain-containing protein [Methylocella sp.]
MFANLSNRLFEKLKSKSYREAYVAEHVRTGIAYQIRALRTQRGWSQKRLAEEMGKPQSVVSRLEDPDYGKVSVQTVLDGAAAFDVALLVQYVSFPEFLRRTRDVSPEGLRVDSFDDQQLPTTTSNVVTISFGNVQTIANLYQSQGGPFANIPVIRGTPQGSVYLPTSVIH